MNEVLLGWVQSRVVDDVAISPERVSLSNESDVA